MTQQWALFRALKKDDIESTVVYVSRKLLSDCFRRGYNFRKSQLVQGATLLGPSKRRVSNPRPSGPRTRADHRRSVSHLTPKLFLPNSQSFLVLPFFNKVEIPTRGVRRLQGEGPPCDEIPSRGGAELFSSYVPRVRPILTPQNGLEKKFIRLRRINTHQ